MSFEGGIYEIKKRWVPIYFLITLTSIVMAIFFLLLSTKTNNEDYLGFSLLAFLVSAYFALNLARLMRFHEPKFKIVRLLVCESCKLSYEDVNIAPGDHIFKEVGTCPKCGGKLKIAAIYRVAIK